MAVLDTSELLTNFTAFEPKTKNRYVLSMGSTAIPGYLVRASSAPGYTDEVITLHHINTYRKFRGKRTWKDLTVTLYDAITPNGSQLVMDWARRSYESVTGRAGYSDFYKEELKFQILGPVGDIVSEWIIKGAFVSDASFGDYDATSSDQAEIVLTISMDYCVLNY